jgi:hypothetical protein
VGAWTLYNDRSSTGDNTIVDESGTEYIEKTSYMLVLKA